MSGRPGKNFHVAKMRHQMTVQSFTSTRDASGQPIASWSNSFIGVPVAFHDVRGGGSYRGEQLQETVDAVFETRFQSGFTTTQRIIFQSETYNITRVSKVDGLGRYLAIYASAVKA